VRAFVRLLREHCVEKTEEGLKPRTVREYNRANMRMFEMLNGAGMETHPAKISRVEINYLRTRIPTNGGNFRNQQWHLQLLVHFMDWCGHPKPRPLLPRYPTGVRTKADWLNEEQMELIRLSVEGNPELSMLFHLEGDMALRRVEVVRLKVQDFDGPLVHVLGKGRGEGKPRDLKKHPETDLYLEAYLEHRENIIRTALREDPSLSVPDGLMVYYTTFAKNYLRLGTCKESTLDNRLYEMRAMSGLYFGHHTLRRTCARELWKCGADIVTIAEMLGHRSLKTTRDYLGLTIEDQHEAYELRYRTQLDVRQALRANPNLSQVQTTKNHTG
jgi:integrase